MKKTSQKIGFKKITLSNLSNEALESLKGGSSYHTYNCPTNSCQCPPPTYTCTVGCGGSGGDNSWRICEIQPVMYE
jgi:hypothetical protein